ncbi:MAG: SRPBCC family protein, partial [Alphaproteobacteria bacterium]
MRPTRNPNRKGGDMTQVNVSQNLKVPADAVWRVIGNFNALAEWHPAVVKSETREEDGATVRTLTLAGGGQIVERLEARDDKDRSYT